MSAFLAYGYNLDKEEQPVFELSENEAFDWYNELYNSPYSFELKDCSFFGVIIVEAKTDNMTEVSNVIDNYWKHWPYCEEQFKKLFPKSKQQPSLYLIGW